MEGTEVTDGPEDSELWLAVSGEGWELCCCVDVTYTKDLRNNVFDLSRKTRAGARDTMKLHLKIATAFALCKQGCRKEQEISSCGDISTQLKQAQPSLERQHADTYQFH